jgi:hypothetical protein
MGLRSLQIVAISTLLATGARADNADRPELHVGDRWSWQHTNGLANERDYTTIEDVIEVSGTEIKTRWRIKGKPNSNIATFTPEWNPVDVVTARYEPLLREFAFPLQVGKKWDASADKMLFSNGKHGKFTVKGEVLGMEKVTEPAGAFDAYKISRHPMCTSATIGNSARSMDSRTRHSSRQRTAWWKSTIGKSLSSCTTWARIKRRFAISLGNGT